MRSVYLCLAAGGCISSGCASPYYADRGAVFGGVAGAGTGALVGHAMGNTGAGAIVGAGVGMLAGSAVGGSLDEIEARNRAQIEASLARPLPPGGVTVDDVVAMSRAGVQEPLIVNHIRANGVARPLQAPDLIRLQQDGVTPLVVQTMQSSPSPVDGQPLVVRGSPPPPVVIVEEYPYGHPMWRPRPGWRRYPPPPPF